jgi:eukaryotic-like serine/threonine-protein kinase
MKDYFKVNTPKGLLIHLGIIAGISLIVILIFFYGYLPAKTNHGESVTVPDLEGIHISAVDDFLTNRSLNYEVTADSGFSEDYAALTILKQYPLPNSKVKENRKIYLTLNASTPPKVKMPRLIDGSVKNAQIVLQSYGLEVGHIRYKPDLAENAILEQLYEGDKIEPGTFIPKGSKIDLVVGDGFGNREFETPDLTGMDYEDAEVAALGSGLQLGSIIYQNTAYMRKSPKALMDSLNLQFIVSRQNPPAGEKVRIGEEVDIWLEELNDQEETILDEAETPGDN